MISISDVAVCCLCIYFLSDRSRRTTALKWFRGQVQKVAQWMEVSTPSAAPVSTVPITPEGVVLTLNGVEIVKAILVEGRCTIDLSVLDIGPSCPVETPPMEGAASSTEEDSGGKTETTETAETQQESPTETTETKNVVEQQKEEPVRRTRSRGGIGFAPTLNRS